MMWWVVGVVLVVVDAHADRDVGLGRRRADDHLAGAGLEVLGRTLALGEEARSTRPRPRRRGRPRAARPGSRSDTTRAACRRRQAAVANLDRPREGAVNRVVPQQVGGGLEIHQVVDRHDLEARSAIPRRPKHVAADSAEPVDRHSNAHRNPRWLTTPCRDRVYRRSPRTGSAGRGGPARGVPGFAGVRQNRAATDGVRFRRAGDAGHPRNTDTQCAATALSAAPPV